MFSFNKKFLSSYNRHIPPMRSYYAAITKNVTPVESRLTQNNDGVALEIMEPYKYKHYWQYHQSHHPAPGLFMGLISNFFKIRRILGWYESSAWRKTFSITSDGKINADPQQILSTPFFDYLMSCEWDQTGSLPKQQEYLPDILYGIPQETWNEFIAKLSSQKVVSNLNLALKGWKWSIV